MLKVEDKERILKAARGNQLVTNKGALIKLSADFSTETLQSNEKEGLTAKITLPGRAII